MPKTPVIASDKSNNTVKQFADVLLTNTEKKRKKINSSVKSC